MRAAARAHRACPKRRPSATDSLPHALRFAHDAGIHARRISDSARGSDAARADPFAGAVAPVLRWLCLCAAVVLIGGCIANPLRWDPDTHIVQAGESLVVIALRYEVPVRDLVAWNGLDNPDRILPGQRLRVTRPSGWSTPKPSASVAGNAQTRPPDVAPPARWYWPAQGTLVPNRNNAGVGDGINVSAALGDPVFATSDGKVVYSGTGLTGYGKLIIIKHNERYLSAYGYNRSLLVSEGDQVRGGQRIATMGYGPARVPMLHFEIRRDGKPVKPLNYLKKQ